MDEGSLAQIFSKFGTMHDLTVIRDKATNIHKGCAFVVYADRESAMDCVDALHEKIKLPNVSRRQCQCAGMRLLFVILSVTFYL
jgi:RNA recognition motif-containing protein